MSPVRKRITQNFFHYGIQQKEIVRQTGFSRLSYCKGADCNVSNSTNSTTIPKCSKDHFKSCFVHVAPDILRVQEATHAWMLLVKRKTLLHH